MEIKLRRKKCSLEIWSIVTFPLHLTLVSLKAFEKKRFRNGDSDKGMSRHDNS